MYRGRFAPTPSGELHLGSLVAAVASFLDARAAQGRWLLRIEDVDIHRCKRHFETALLFELERHGLHWDELVIRQSDRLDAYRSVLERLRQSGRICPFTCSRSSLLKMGCQVNAEGELIYPSICRNASMMQWGARSLSEATGISVRFKVEDTPVIFKDDWLGPQTQWVSRDVGDFVLRRNDGCYAYHLAVVVDDFEQGITHIVRGRDILSLTARHVLLQQALGFPTPVYKHCPLVQAADGSKLSKSASAQALKMTPAVENLKAAFRFLGMHSVSSQAGTCEELLAHAVKLWPQMSFSS